jgi:hypothetical protein
MNYVIQEIDKNDVMQCSSVSKIIDELFPEYAPTHIEKRLNMNGESKIPKVSIVIISNGNEILAFAQLIYKLWNDGIIVDLDLLGTRKQYQRQGYANILFQYCIKSLGEVSKNENKKGSGLISLIDPNQVSIRNLHIKHNGQIRDDKILDFGDAVVWYPKQKELEKVETIELIKQVNEFGNIIQQF